MNSSTRFQRALVTVSLLCLLTPGLRADILSDNLSTVNADTEAVVGDTWITASFTTDARFYHLGDATLLLANITSGAVQLDLYSDAGQPASMLSAFTSPLFFTSDLSPTTFAGSGFLLAPNSTYWLVLKAPSGEFDWGWTEDAVGAGVGFTHTWGFSDDAGTTWTTADIEPMQFRLEATPTPEPASLAFFLTALVPLVWWFSTRRFRASR